MPGKQAVDKASDRSNKKAEVIAMMKRAKGVTLAEIMEATKWQKHTVRGFVSMVADGVRWVVLARNSADNVLFSPDPGRLLDDPP